MLQWHFYSNCFLVDDDKRMCLHVLLQLPSEMRCPKLVLRCVGLWVMGLASAPSLGCVLASIPNSSFYLWLKTNKQCQPSGKSSVNQVTVRAMEAKRHWWMRGSGRGQERSAVRTGFPCRSDFCQKHFEERWKHSVKDYVFCNREFILNERNKNLTILKVALRMCRWDNSSRFLKGLWGERVYDTLNNTRITRNRRYWCRRPAHRLQTLKNIDRHLGRRGSLAHCSGRQPLPHRFCWGLDGRETL